MELKQYRRDRGEDMVASINRTFMELKQILIYTHRGGRFVLIEPLWN